MTNHTSTATASDATVSPTGDLPGPSSACRRAGRRRGRPHAHLPADLDAEWRRLRSRPSTLRRVRSWPDRLAGTVETSFADALRRVAVDARDLDDVVDATHRRPWRVGARPIRDGRPDADVVLAAIVAMAPDDELAARIVVQRVLPLLIAKASRWWRPDAVHPIDLVVAAAWLAVRRYDVRSRPTCIADRIASDAIWSALRRDLRYTSREVPVPTGSFDDVPDAEPVVDPIVSLAAVVRVAGRAGVGDDHLEVVRRLARATTVGQVATGYGITTRSVRTRRSVAVTRIRAALGDWGACDDPLVVAA